MPACVKHSLVDDLDTTGEIPFFFSGVILELELTGVEHTRFPITVTNLAHGGPSSQFHSFYFRGYPL